MPRRRPPHPRPAPDLPLVLDPGPHLCGLPSAGTALKVKGGSPMEEHDPFWLELRDSPLMAGWREVVSH